MSAYADASALVKWYSLEEGSTIVQRFDAPVVTSSLSMVEVPSAFWMKVRSTTLSDADASILTAAFAHDLAERRLPSGATVDLVALSEAVLRNAVDYCRQHELKSADAVHLATASIVRDVDPSCASMLVFDRSLARAATAEGFDVLG